MASYEIPKDVNAQRAVRLRNSAMQLLCQLHTLAADYGDQHEVAKILHEMIDVQWDCRNYETDDVQWDRRNLRVVDGT